MFFIFPDIPVFLPYLEGCDVCCEHQLYNLLKPAGLGSVLYFPEMRKCVKKKSKMHEPFSVFGSWGIKLRGIMNIDRWCHFLITSQCLILHSHFTTLHHLIFQK